MATKKYLYGNLNQDTVRPNYGGSTTESLTINVDNDNMIISGEVNWDAALGELAHKAYPGDKGARNYSKILELTALLNEEVETAKKSRESVETKVGILEKSFQELNTSLTTAIEELSTSTADSDKSLLNQCKAETERALTAESAIITELRAEVLKRETVDADLIKRLDELSGLSGDSLEVVKSLITAETTRATEVETSLQASIDEETTRAKEVEDKLQVSITAVDKKIDESVESIELSLATEHTERQTADNVITELIENEVTRAQDAEGELTTSLTALSNTLAKIEDIVTDLQTVVTNSGTSTEKIEQNVSALQTSVAELDETHIADVERLENDITAVSTKHDTDIDIVGKSIEELKNSSTHNTQVISKLSGQLKNIESSITTLDASIRNTQASVEHETSVRLANDDAIKATIADIDKKVDQQKTDLETSITTVDNKTSELADKIQLTDSAVKSLEAQLESLVEADVITAEEFNRVNNTLNTVYNNISGLTQSLTNETSRAESVESELKQETEDLQTQLNATDSQQLELINQVQVVVDIVNALTLRIAEVANDTAGYSDSIDQLTSRVETLETTADAEKLVIESEFTALNNKIDAVSSRVDQIPADIDKLEESVTALDTTVKELTQETYASKDSVEALQSDVDTVSDRVSGLQDQVDNTTARIDETLAEHKTALVKHDVSTHQHDVDIAALQGEINRLDDVDTSIKESIQQTNNQVDADRNLHLAHYNEIVSRLEQEIKRAVEADTSLLSDTSRNSGRITALQLDLTNVITKYVEELTQADQQLNDKIDYEHIVTEEYKQKILDEVADVEAESIQRDNVLQAQIEVITSKKDSVPLMENDGDIAELYAQQGDKTFTIPTEKAVVAEAVVRRDTAGNVLLNTDTDAFTTHSAVSRLFVENIMTELREELGSITFDFIDGGNAPID